ncbi:unnamed protein product [Calicophoron daubneyi]|uniref:Uncharacterized protein n=1 Tax=Calicophoron daubneyi TaxID=300641 RepID=A0AAV2TL06_CALDB
MATKSKHEGGMKARGLKSELINYDGKNENIPLKQEVAIRKAGGLFLASNGAKVEIPPGASTGRRERLLCISLSSSARGILGPWLGPNLRMGSDIQLVYCPTSFKQQVALFIPFSFATARELTYPIKGDTDTQEQGRSSIVRENSDSDVYTPSTTPARSVKSMKTKTETPTLLSSSQQGAKRPPVIDTRSVFLLRCKLGEDRWDIDDDFTVIQPTVHHTQWPPEIKRLVAQSARWPDQSYVENTPSEGAYGAKRLSTTVQRNRRQAHPIRETDPLETTRKIESYCGGVCIATEELSHCYVVVVGARAENFPIDRDGGFYRSPLLHPFLSVRIPKRSCPESTLGIFKAIEIRSGWTQSACQFDTQLVEVEGCSDIYELDLGDVVLKRPATIRLPLPQWFIERRRRFHDNSEQNSTTIPTASDVMDMTAKRVDATEGTFIHDRPLTILYQPPGFKRQIVWQVANTEEMRDEINRRKSRVNVNRKDNLNTPICKIDNLFGKLGWSHLAVGVRGGPWQVMKQPVYYTQRTAFFESNILGRFVMIGARDPDKTAQSKLAHLMSRVEALASSPPGALLVCLQLQQNSWRLMANVYQEERLNDVIQELIAQGFVPLIQMSAGPARKTNGLTNAVLQAIEFQQSSKDGLELAKDRKKDRPYRVNGMDVSHVLMYNGLCLEIRCTGDVRLKTQGQCDAMVNLLKVKDPNKSTENSEEKTTDYSAQQSYTSTPVKRTQSAGKRNARGNIVKLLTKHARMQHQELMHETACLVDIEPLPTAEVRYTTRSMTKANLVSALMKISYQKQELGQDDDDEDDDDEDESEGGMGIRTVMEGLRGRSGAYDGDDGEWDEATKEAMNTAMQDLPLPVTAINNELIRRLSNVAEKNKSSRAVDFINKIISLYHVGTVELWLVPPDQLQQLSVPSDITKGSKSRIYGLISDISDGSSSGEDDEFALLGLGKHSKMTDNSATGGHNAIRWNPTENLTDAPRPVQNTFVLDGSTSPKKPIAVYNLLIDPDLVVNYLRAPQSRGGGASASPKKGNKSRSNTIRSISVQKNVSAQDRMRWHSPSSNLSPSNTDQMELGDNADAEELQLLTPSRMRMIAEQVQEPEKLANALGLPVEEVDRINTLIANDKKIDPSFISYEVLKIWKNSYHPTNITLCPSDCDRMSDGVGRNSAETDLRSPLSDLIDALQSLAYFDAVEMINGFTKEPAEEDKCA